jgi:predicted DsbA family dithiol-disulfide isomerase
MTSSIRTRPGINQQNLKEKLLGIAKEEGLKIDKFTACIDKKETQERVQKQMQEGNEVGVRSTPCFYINGHQILGAQPAEAFEGVIKKELSR